MLVDHTLHTRHSCKGMCAHQTMCQTVRIYGKIIPSFPFRGLSVACVVAYIATVQTKEAAGDVVLEADCAVDPSAPGCRRPSFLDMINGINNRAQVYFNLGFVVPEIYVRTLKS